MLEQTLYGILSGTAYAFAGWQGQTKKKDIEFDWKKLGKSVVGCSIVGAVAGYTGQDFNLLVTGSLGVGVTKGVSVLWKLANKYYRQWRKQQ